MFAGLKRLWKQRFPQVRVATPSVSAKDGDTALRAATLRTAMIKALSNENAVLFARLCKESAYYGCRVLEDDGTALMVKACTNDLPWSAVITLIDAGVTVNPPSGTVACTPLQGARHDPERMKALIDLGADPNGTNVLGETVVHKTVNDALTDLHGQVWSRVTTWSALGIDINARRCEGTCLHDMVQGYKKHPWGQRNHNHLLKGWETLLAHGADPMITDDHGNTAAHAVAQSECDERWAMALPWTTALLEAKNEDGDTVMRWWGQTSHPQHHAVVAHLINVEREAMRSWINDECPTLPTVAKGNGDGGRRRL